VFGKLRLLLKAFPADVTLERLESRVNAQVVFQVAFFVERFFAFPTEQDRVESFCLGIHYLFPETTYSINSQ
jgi:hypothetical protein